MNLLSQNWQNILVKGRHNSGKSELTLWMIKQILSQSKEHFINHLLDEQEKILLLTESVNQVELINLGLNNRIHLVENISTKNPFEYLRKYHEEYGIEILVIDYLNLLINFSINNPHDMESLLGYLSKYQIKWIFVESTYKLLKENLKVDQMVENILHTTSKDNDGIEIFLTKEKGKSLSSPKQYRVKV